MINISHFGWAQWLCVTLITASILISILNHGRPMRPHNYNALGDICRCILALAVFATSGFFK